MLLGIVFFLIYRLTWYLTGEMWLSLLVFTLPIGFLLINFLLRKRLRYKSWFLSPANLFLERKMDIIESDLDADLLFDKLLEVIETSEFQLLDADKLKLQILCGTSLNFWTWGENIYIDIQEKSFGSTLIHLQSTTLYGNSSWDRNGQNHDSFMASLEASLTI